MLGVQITVMSMLTVLILLLALSAPVGLALKEMAHFVEVYMHVHKYINAILPVVYSGVIN